MLCSSANVERSFSSVKFVRNSVRNRLNHETVHKLIFVRANGQAFPLTVRKMRLSLFLEVTAADLPSDEDTCAWLDQLDEEEDEDEDRTQNKVSIS